MDKQTLIEKLQTMAASPSCYPDLKQIATTYIKLAEAEKVAAKNLLAEIDADIMSVDELVKESHSEEVLKKFGAETARKLAANADALKASGAKYCNCMACTTGLEILADRESLFDKTARTDKQTLIGKIKALAASPSCYPDLKQIAETYVKVFETEQVAAKNLIAELEEDVIDVDTLIKNVGDTEHVIKFFGVEGAKLFIENAYKLKASGAKYCNCLACTIGLEVLENKEILLA